MDSQKHKPAGLLDELNSDPDSVPEEDEERMMMTSKIAKMMTAERNRSYFHI